MSLKLFSDEENETVSAKAPDIPRLGLNKRYSQQYDQWRTKEELSKLQSKYGQSVDSDDSECTDEDDLGEELTENVEIDFLETYSLLKQRNKKIYDPKFKAFQRSNTDPTPKRVKAAKKNPLTLKEAEFKQALVKRSELSGDESEGSCSDKPELTSAYYEELDRSKKAFLNVAKDVVCDEQDGDFLLPKDKTAETKEIENRDYMAWLRSVDPANAMSKSPSKELIWLRGYWNNDRELSADDKFLRNYILDRKYRIDESFVEPEYDEKLDFSDEDSELERAEKFEHRYNFRFEEPDKNFIKSYPRTVKGSFRKEDSRRKERRTKYKERKMKEITRFAEEMKRMKALKAKETEQRLARIREVAGSASIPPTLEQSLNDDFNPGDYDNHMGALFDDDYYAENEPRKPALNDSDEIFNCDNMSGNVKTTGQSLSRHQRKKRKLKEIRQLHDEEGGGTRSDRHCEEEGFEDVVAGIPCRFKYRSVVANDFGLDMDEILKAENKELNKWVSLRRTVQYRTDEQEYFDQRAYAKRKVDMRKKERILKSIYGSPDVNVHKTEKTTQNASLNHGVQMTDERMEAYGLNPKKMKRKLKYGKK